MGRGGRKSQNQKFRVKKIGNLGYKSGEMDPQRKLGTYLSSRWSWRSESSANRSPTVAPLFSRCSWTLFSRNSQRRGGCEGGGEEKRRVWLAWWPVCFAVAGGDVSGREASPERECAEGEIVLWVGGGERRVCQYCRVWVVWGMLKIKYARGIFLLKLDGPRAGPF